MYTGVWKITIFNISCFILQTIQDMAMVTTETNSNSYAIYRMVPFPMILSDPQSRHSSMSNNKLVRPVSVDSSTAAAADTKSKCKLSKNLLKNLKSVSKISSTVFLLIRTQIMCVPSFMRIRQTVRQAIWKKFDNTQTSRQPITVGDFKFR